MDNSISAEFWARHGIPNAQSPFLAEPAILALELSRPVFISAFDQAPLPKETSGLVVRAFENISDRLYEQAAGMLVCLGTGSAAAAETIARTVIEGSLNFLFIVSQDHEARLFGFFQEYLHEHERRLHKWQQSLSASAAAHTAEQKTTNTILNDLQAHLSAHKKLSDFVMSLARGLGFQQIEALSKRWPSKFSDRCEQVGKSDDYLTSYHRLSASSHINAEETIRWLFGYYFAAIGQDPELPKKLAVETVSYSAMMTRIAVMHYIEANVASCRALNAGFDAAPLAKAIPNLRASIDAIALAAGAPH